jgi:hypothetical protein
MNWHESAARLSTISLSTNQSLYVDTPAKLDQCGNDCLFLLDFSQLIVL